MPVHCGDIGAGVGFVGQTNATDSGGAVLPRSGSGGTSREVHRTAVHLIPRVVVPEVCLIETVKTSNHVVDTRHIVHRNL